MVEYEFNSLLGAFIDAFIRQKQASGYPYKPPFRRLLRATQIVMKMGVQQSSPRYNVSEGKAHYKAR